MDNPQILKHLEQQRDALFQKLKSTSISELYKQEYAEIKSGRIFVFDNGERQMLSELKRLSKDTTLDAAYHAKLSEYASLENEELINHFENEFVKLFDAIIKPGKQDDIQALFIEYDDYYFFNALSVCYGRRDYPLVTEPRYIMDEYDYNKQVLWIENGINFEPAWPDCSEFDDLEYLEVSHDLEVLFQLHSRTLLHRALDRLDKNGQLNFLTARPFMFYINEHDCEVMTLYKLEV